MTTSKTIAVDAYAEDDDPGTDTLDSKSAAEREVTGELVQGELAGQPIYVPPVKKWKSSALHALRNGDFETWAEKTLPDDDFDLWLEVDPDMEQIEEFFASINSKIGVNTGNSRASRRSSRTTRKR